MAQYVGMVLTNKGKDLQAKAEAGATLTFTHVKIGDGQIGSGQTLEGLNDLINPLMTLDIASALADGGVCRVRSSITNQGLAEGFYIRELGLFAQDPDIGEILYAITTASAPDYLPAEGGPVTVNNQFDIVVIVGTASNVNAVTVNGLVVSREQQALTEGQTVIDIANFTYEPGDKTLQVYIDGDFKYVDVDYDETDSNTITLYEAVPSGEHKIELVRIGLGNAVVVDMTEIAEARSGYASLGGRLDAMQLNIKRESFSVTLEGQTVFDLTLGEYNPGTNQLWVFVNGVFQIPGVDFSETSSTRFTMAEGIHAGQVVLAMYYEASSTAVQPWKGHRQRHYLGGGDEILVHGNQVPEIMIARQGYDSLLPALRARGLNALEYITGDGETDDKTDLQSAANEAAANKIPLLIPYRPNGIRITGSIVVPRNSIIVNDGAISGHILNDSGDPAFVVQGTGTEYLTRLLHSYIKGLYITTPSTTGSIDAGSNELTVASTTALTLAVGRVIRVAGAGVAGRNLISEIVDIVGNVAALNDNASTAVTNAAVTNADAIGIYSNLVGQCVVRDIITDGGSCGIKMVDGSEIEYSNIEAHGCRWPVWFECTGNVSGNGNKDFAVVNMRDFTLSGYDEDGMYIKNIRHLNTEGKIAIAHNTTDITKAGIRLVAESGAIWTDRTNKLINLNNVFFENMGEAPDIIIESADIVNMENDYLSGNTNPKVVVKSCRVLNVHNSTVDNFDFNETEYSNKWLKLESTVTPSFKLNVSGEHSRYNTDIAILDERAEVYPLLNHGMQAILYPDMSRCGCAVTCNLEPIIDGANFKTGYNSLYWANAGNEEIYAVPNITNLDELQPGDTIYVEMVGTDNLKIKFMHSSSYAEPAWAYYTVQTLTTVSGKTLKRKFAKLTLVDKLNGIRMTNEDDKSGEVILDYLQVYCRKKLNCQNMFTYGINPESPSKLYGTINRGEKFYALDHHMEWEAVSKGSYGTLTATATGASGESTAEITITAGQIFVDAVVNFAGLSTDHTIRAIDGSTIIFTPALGGDISGAAVTFKAATWQVCGFSPRDCVKTLELTPGVSGAYGATVNGYSASGYRGLYPARVLVTFSGEFAPGETVTVRIGVNHMNSSTPKTVDIVGTETGDVWLTDAELVKLLDSGYISNGVYAMAKSDQASTIVMPTVTFYGLYI